jgi:uncharacterized protein (DUF3084 family)
MNRQRGIGLIEIAIYLGLFAVVAGGIWKAWDSFKNSIAAPYVAEQVAKDQGVIDGFKKNAETADSEAANARKDRDAAQKAAKEQSDALLTAQQEQERAQAAARVLSVKYAQAMVANAKRVTDLQSRAGGDPVAKDCVAMLSATDAILRDSARVRLGAQ